MSSADARSRTSGRRLQAAARFSRISAATGFAVLSLCVLGEVALDFAEAREREGETPAPPPRELPTLAGIPPQGSAVPSRPAPTEAPAPPPSPRQILIDLGPPRSEVFVDGRHVGRTPFVGQVTCRPGREISIHVVPERGFPIQEQRVCPR